MFPIRGVTIWTEYRGTFLVRFRRGEAISDAPRYSMNQDRVDRVRHILKSTGAKLVDLIEDAIEHYSVYEIEPMPTTSEDQQ